MIEYILVSLLTTLRMGLGASIQSCWMRSGVGCGQFKKVLNRKNGQARDSRRGRLKKFGGCIYNGMYMIWLTQRVRAE